MEFTEAQRRAITARNHPIVVMASAGSGKTRVMVERYLALLQEGLKPSEILMLTFTTDAANEMRERVEKRVGGEVSGAAIGTIHSFCFQLIQAEGERIGLPPIEQVWEPMVYHHHLTKKISEWQKSLNEDQWKELLSLLRFYEVREWIEWFLEHPEYLQHSIEPPADRIVELLKPAIESFQSLLLEKRALSFREMELFAAQILETQPEVRERLQNQYKAILIDEFQDTSPRQWNILNAVLGPHSERLFVVGDPRQSIYSFRGADPFLFEEISAFAKEKGGEVIELDTNFRTGAGLLNRLNEILEPLSFGRMQAGENVSGELLIEKCGGEKEAEAIAEKVQQKITDGTKPSEIALLFRVSDRMSQFAKALLQKGVPIATENSDKVENHYDSHDLLSFFRWAKQPQDPFYLAQFRRSRFIGHTNQGLVTRPQEPIPWTAPTGNWREALNSLFSNSSYWPHDPTSLLWLHEILPDPSSSLDEAIEFLEGLRNRGWKSLRHETGQSEGVHLMTVHGSKGLEFDHVFLVDTARGRRKDSPLHLPSREGKWAFTYPSEDGDRHQSSLYSEILEKQRQNLDAESLRVLYVAMTRARQSLHLVLPESPEERIPKESWSALLTSAL